MINCYLDKSKLGFTFYLEKPPHMYGYLPLTREEMSRTNFITNTGLQFSMAAPALHFDEAVIGLLTYREIFPRRPLDYVIDIGANAGGVGILAAQMGAIRCLLVEPTYTVRLWYNVYVNQYEDRCVVLPYAIWLSDGQPLNMLAEADPATVSNIELAPNQTALPTFQLSFSTLLNMLPRVDFLKIDVDGAEFAFLNDTAREALKRVSFLDLELHVSDKARIGNCDVTGFLSEEEHGSEPAARRIVKMLLDEGFKLWGRGDENDPDLFQHHEVYKAHLLFYRP